ncbi:MAG: DUF2513 domain-containing protein [Phycisphaerae bacterium]|nr:DUF2513 domain-containing protein [Phycisphaerae bacterium]
MKRDMDLVRQLLLKIEEHEHGLAPRNLPIDGYDDEQIGYHVHLMGQAGLLKVADVTHLGSASPEAIPVRMTWAGHDFLDAARSETIWSRAKDHLGANWASVPFEVLKSLLVKFISESVGISDA